MMIRFGRDRSLFSFNFAVFYCNLHETSALHHLLLLLHNIANWSNHHFLQIFYFIKLDLDFDKVKP